MVNDDDGSMWVILKIYIDTNNFKLKTISIVQFITLLDILVDISYMCICLNNIYTAQLLIFK